MKDNWGALFTTIKFKIDGYDVCLQAGVIKMRVYVTCYVNGSMKGIWLSKKEGQYPEEGKRFFQLHKKAVISAKEMKRRQKIFGKRSDFSKQSFYEYLSPNWSSFSAFKKHIIENNKDIQLIRKP